MSSEASESFRVDLVAPTRTVLIGTFRIETREEAEALIRVLELAKVELREPEK